MEGFLGLIFRAKRDSRRLSLGIHRVARAERLGPGEPLRPGRHLGGISVGINRNGAIWLSTGTSGVTLAFGQSQRRIDEGRKHYLAEDELRHLAEQSHRLGSERMALNIGPVF